MRKLIVTVASLVALAAIAVPFANAATANADGAVTVTKGDIQAAMGWNNAAWETAISAPNGVATVGNLITTAGSMPVDVPGGWLTLNGQIVANYPNDEYYESFTNPENWGPFSTPVSSYWTGGIDTTVTPILNAQNKVTGFTVSAAPTARRLRGLHPAHDLHEPRVRRGHVVYHATSRWPVSIAGSGVSDVKVDGKAVTVTPYVAATV